MISQETENYYACSILINFCPNRGFPRDILFMMTPWLMVGLGPWGGEADMGSSGVVYEDTNDVEVSLMPESGVTFDIGDFDPFE